MQLHFKLAPVHVRLDIRAYETAAAIILLTYFIQQLNEQLQCITFIYFTTCLPHRIVLYNPNQLIAFCQYYSYTLYLKKYIKNGYLKVSHDCKS